jgi:hypothetical protein
MANNEFAHTREVDPERGHELPEVLALIQGSGAWNAVLLEEERQCRSFGFGAVVVSISVPLDLDSPTGPGRTLVDAVRAPLRPTDRIAVLSPTELSVLLIPMASIHEAQALVTAVHTSLRRVADGTCIGWAARAPRHDLLHAAAHADAAMARARPSSRLPAAPNA